MFEGLERFTPYAVQAPIVGRERARGQDQLLAGFVALKGQIAHHREELAHQLFKQAILVLEVKVERSFAHPRLACDVLDPGALDTVVRKGPTSRGQQLGAGVGVGLAGHEALREFLNGGSGIPIVILPGGSGKERGERRAAPIGARRLALGVQAGVPSQGML